MVSEVGALGKHIALVGFMGAGKTTIGREVARLTERPFVDTDEEVERRHGPIARLFEERGEAEFRRLEEHVAGDALASDEPAVIALGGGAVASERTRERLARRALTVWLSVSVDDAWERVSGTGRPLARDEERFRELYRERLGFYVAAADSVAASVDGVLLASLALDFRPGGVSKLDAFEEGRRLAVVVDERVAELHPPRVAGRVHPVPPGEEAKRAAVAQRLWSELELGRDGTILAVGGGSTTDLAGFLAATYLRGVPWIAVPTTLVGQVDAAIGGKTGIDLAGGKNLVGAFHFPDRVVIDPGVLSTLPQRERRKGMAEAVKTGLLAGEPLWDLPEDELILGAATFKAAVVVSDPYERGRRAILNLGHTFAHALEAGSRYALSHGDAVALGLRGALRLSSEEYGLDEQLLAEVERVLAPTPVPCDGEVAWAALQRDKKAAGGRTRLVLLRSFGDPVFGVELADERVRAALDRLIAN